MRMIDTFVRICNENGLLDRSAEAQMKDYLHRISNDYTQMFYNSKPWSLSKYKGISTQKFPTDSWILQEIVYDIKPDLIIECGTMEGGTTLMYADLLESLNKGIVVSIDINQNGNLPQHNRIKYLRGSSTDEGIFNQVREIAEGKEVVMVDLDSYHSKVHVDKELELYGNLVTKDSYLIVEDTIISGHPVEVKEENGTLVNPGPYEAVMEFLRKNGKFAIDIDRERFNLTTNPSGYLRRVK